MLKVTLLQTPGVELDGKPVTFPFKRVDALFYYMVVRRSATRQELVSLLWESCDEAVGLKNLRNTLYTLKKCLGGDFLLSPQKALIVVNEQWELECDYDRFTREGDFSAYQGPFLGGFFVKHSFSFEAWMMRTRENLHTQYLHRLEEQAKAAFALGEWDRAGTWAAAYLRDEPFDEAMASFLMTSHRHLQQYAKAADVYQQLKSRLEKELGANPLSGTTALYYEIMNEWNDTTRSSDRENAPVPVGREKAYAGLQAAYDAFCDGTDRRCAQVLTGEAGSGKSRLISHFIQNTDLSGFLVLRSFCLMSEEQLPLAPFDTLMMALGEFIHVEGISLPPHITEYLNQMFLLSGSPQSKPIPHVLRQANQTLLDNVLLALSAVCRRKKILLILEDIQWLDNESTTLLGALLRRIDPGSILTILTRRTDCRREITAFLEQATTDELIRQHRLYPLSLQETQRFLQRELGQDTAQQLYSQFFEQTGGNLHLLTELTQAYRYSGNVEEVARSMGEILMDRLSGLPQEALQVAELIAIFPEKTSAAILLRLADGDDRKLSCGLEALKKRGLIEESQGGSSPLFHFAHQRLRQLVYDQMSFFQRQPLHQKAAQLLAAEASRQDPQQCRSVALQFELAGQRLSAAEYRIYALECESTYNCEPFPMFYSPRRERTSASTLWEQSQREMSELSALRRAHEVPEVLAVLERMLLLIQGRIALFQGRIDEGSALLGTLSGGEMQQDTGLMVKACYLLARTALYTQAAALAERYTDTGMRLLDHNADPRLAARFQHLRGNCFCLRAEYEKSVYYLIEAMDYFEKQPDRESCQFQLAEAYLDFAKVCRQKRSYAKAASYYKKALDIVERGTPPAGTVWLYTHYARMAFALEDHTRARKLFQQGWDTAHLTGELWGAAAAASFCAYYASLDGLYDQAAEYLSAAQRYAGQLNAPIERTILSYVSMMLSKHLELERITTGPLNKLLDKTAEDYARQGIRLLAHVPDVFEAELLSRGLREGIAFKSSVRASELYSKNKHFMTE